MPLGVIPRSLAAPTPVPKPHFVLEPFIDRHFDREVLSFEGDETWIVEAFLPIGGAVRVIYGWRPGVRVPWHG